MTHERDVEHLLDAWLADGPLQVTDRAFDDAVARVARQAQRPAWRLRPWRSSTMSTSIRILALAGALLAALIAGGLILTGGGARPVPSPTPTPPALPDGLLDPRDYTMRSTPDDPMAFAITAPEGWTGYGGFFIGGPNLSDAPGGIGISVNHDPQVVTDPCDGSVHTPAPASSGPSVDDLVAALSARQDLQVSGVTDAALAGYSGKRLDLQLPAQEACARHYVFAEPKGLYANGPANRWRVWLLDVDGDTAVVVLLDYAATPAEDRASAQTAIDSLRITP
jgi:hypothetical protein